MSEITYKFLVDIDDLFDMIGKDKDENLIDGLWLYKSFVNACLYGRDDMSFSFKDKQDRDTCAKDWSSRFGKGVIKIV